MSDCYYDGDGCLVCPEQESQPYIPSRVEQRAVLGWNSGANSINTVDGDLHVVFTQPLGVVGVVIGLKGSRAQQVVPSQIEHGWYFQRSGGLDIVQTIERGQVLGNPITGRGDDTVFEIRRSEGVVTYLMDGAVVRTSSVRSEGAKVANCCMYASGDAAPSGSSGDGTTNLLHEEVSFAEGDTSWTTSQGWSVTVPSGSSKVSFVLTPAAGNPADVAMAVNFGSRPTGEYGVADPTSWSGFTYEGAAGDSVPNAGPVDFTLDFNSPTAGTWYVVLGGSAAASGYTLDVTLTT